MSGIMPLNYIIIMSIHTSTYCYWPLLAYTYIFTIHTGALEVLEQKTKAVVAEAKLDMYTDASKEVHEILEAKGDYLAV